MRVPTLSQSLDRNGVQALIAGRKQELRELAADWERGEFLARCERQGTGMTNGALELQITAQQERVATFRGRGEDARLYVGEYEGSLSGTECLDGEAAASRAGDSEAAARWSRLHGFWKQARDVRLAELEETLALLRDDLEAHRDALDAARAAIQTDLDTRLTWALGETPCGGSASVDGDPLAAKVQQHLEQLRLASETEEEALRRTGEYGDRVYVEAEGTVHGDLAEAWAWAMRDTGMTRPGVDGHAATILRMKDLADYLSAFADLEELAEANAKLQDFLDAVAALDPLSEDFFAQRRILRQLHLANLDELLEGGVLSETRLTALYEAVNKLGSGGSESRLLKRRLLELRALSQRWSGGPRQLLRTRLEAGEELAGAAKDSYRSMVRSSLAQANGGWAAEGRSLATSVRANLEGMSNAERGLLFLSVASAAADAHQNMEAGMATSEAVARAAVGLAIELAIAGIPVAAAAEMGTQLLFTSARIVTGYEAYTDATLENTSKWVATQAFDGVAAAAGQLGHGWQVLSRDLAGEPGMDELLANVDFVRLRRSLSHVEGRLDALAPGDPAEQDLLRMRQTFRELIRAKQAGG